MDQARGLREIRGGLEEPDSSLLNNRSIFLDFYSNKKSAKVADFLGIHSYYTDVALTC